MNNCYNKVKNMSLFTDEEFEKIKEMAKKD